MTLVASALAGGSWIDDCDKLRAGSTGRVLGHRVFAPSTIGTFLGSFTWGSARQLDRVAAEALGRAWANGAGPGPWPYTIDVDSTICEVYGLAKQGAAFGHTRCAATTRCWPLAPAPATCWAPGWAAVTPTPPAGRPASSPRRSTGSVPPAPPGRSACGPTRASTPTRWSRSASRPGALLDHRQVQQGGPQGDPADPDDAWVPIGYWLEGGADVAETSYRPFGKRGPAVRLIVRRVRPPRARSWRWT
jgi:hypothetical protein